MRCVVACCGALLLASAPSTPASASHFDIQPLVLENAGEVPGGGLINGLTRASGITALGEVLVGGYVWDGVTIDHNVFLFGGAGGRIVLAAGEPAPGGGTWSDFEPVVNAAGDLAFTGVVDFATFGAWRRTTAGDSIIALPGGAAPLAGATWTNEFDLRGLSDSGSALFFARVSTPSGDRLGWFLDDGASQQPVVLNGDPAPGGGVFDGIGAQAAALIDGDSVAFQAGVVGGSGATGLYRWDGGVVTQLVVAGGAVTTPRGGSFEEIRTWIDANASGAVVFVADIVRDGNSALPALFVLEGGTLREILYFGDAVPGSPGRHLGGAWAMAISGTGQVAFTAPLLEAPWSGLFFWDGAGITPLVLADTPEAGGHEFYQFGDRLELEDAGRIAFEAGSTDLAAWGVFTARPVEAVPALPGAGSLLLPLCLAAAAAFVLRRGGAVSRDP